MPIVIEKGIPLQRRGGELWHALQQMEVGDSFTYPTEERNALSQRFALLRPKKFATRRIDGNGTIRVWRIE